MSYFNDIKRAIEENRLIRISYQGREDKTPEVRVLEPISLGVFSPKNPRYGGKSRGKLCVRGWIRSTSYSHTVNTGNYKDNDVLTKRPGYRMFLLGRIKDLKILKEKFSTSEIFIERNRPKINPAKDKDMQPVLDHIQISENIAQEPEFIFNNVKDIIYKSLSKSVYKTKFDKIMYMDFKKSFYTDNDFKNFRVKANMSTKLNKIFDYIMFNLLDIKNYNKFNPESKERIREMKAILTRYFMSNVKKFNPTEIVLQKIQDLFKQNPKV
jgi:hypothetical protein